MKGTLLFGLCLLLSWTLAQQTPATADPAAHTAPRKKPKYKKCSDSHFCRRIRTFVTSQPPLEPHFHYFVSTTDL